MNYTAALIELKRQLVQSFKLEEWHADMICGSIEEQTAKYTVTNINRNYFTTKAFVNSFASWSGTKEGTTYWCDLFICLPDDLERAKDRNAKFLVPPKRPVHHINIMD